MKENLLSAIKAHNFTAIRNICFGLSEEERTATLALFEYHTIKALLTDELKKQGITYIPKGISTILSYALICLCRNAEELKAAEINIRIRNLDKEHYCYFLDTQYAVPLLELLQSPKGAYLQEIIEKMYKAYPMEMSFEILWTLYKHKRIAFNGELMMFNLHYRFDNERDKIALAKYLLQNPETATEIFHLVPMYLKDARFNAKETLEMYEDLIQGGFFADRTIISLFIEGLLNPLKKNTADFFCRVVELLNPITKELLTSQHTLFALLSSDKTSVINFAMKHIKQIAEEKAFDFQSFADNFALCFTTQKIAKSQLVGLDILEKHYKKQTPANPEYREQLAVLFTVPDVKLQEKVASLLTTYFGGEGLAEVVTPYRDYLKIPQPVPLSEKEEAGSKEDVSALSEDSLPLEVGKLEVPTTAEDLLFLLGDCIREGTAATIDLFFEGLVQLQDQLPENFKEQLAPYIKQLGSYSVSGQQVRAMLLLLRGWAEDKAIETPPKEWQPYIKKARELGMSEDKKDQQESAWLWCVFSTHKELLYFFNKIKATISKLKNGDRLPFLATPSVKPFYIDADTLANRLLIYQAAGKEPELDDIVVAANRLLSSTITPEAKDKVRTLTGKYARAMAYLFELTDVITPEEETLPLWTQMTRIKYPNAIFDEFENTSANDYPAVAKPFYIHSYTIDDCKFHLENDYNYHGFKKEKALPYNFYNAGNYDKLHSSTFKYFMSLNPQYLDALLCRYVPYWVRINDATIYEDLNKITTFLLANNLRIYQSGWLFMGIAFLHDKKETRDLATEYILRAISRDEDLSYLQHFLADILAQKLTPINRFMEFLDIPTRDPKIKAFQKAVVEAYLPLAEQLDKKPTNHKKLADWRM